MWADTLKIAYLGEISTYGRFKMKCFYVTGSMTKCDHRICLLAEDWLYGVIFAYIIVYSFPHYHTTLHREGVMLQSWTISLGPNSHFWCFCRHTRREHNFTCLTSPPKTSTCSFNWFLTLHWAGRENSNGVFFFFLKESSSFFELQS